MSPRSPRSSLALAAAVLGAVVAVPAAAVIPSIQKIADTVARMNRAAGRAEPLLLDVSLRIGDSPPLASGVLATHPTGLARLELRSKQGFVERHLLQGSEYTASRDGELLPPSRTRPFLPPVFLLQSGSGAALRAALSSFGVSAAEVALGLADDHDCYVLGGRLPRTSRGEERRLPSVWVDTDSFDVVRIDRQDGVRFRFGPPGTFDEIQVPSWISIEAPGQEPVRLDVLRAAKADAPAAAFGTDWLISAPAP